jgi:hypothetical protein
MKISIKNRIIIRIMYVITNIKFFLRKLFNFKKNNDLTKEFIQNGIIEVNANGISNEILKLLEKNKLDSNLTVVNKNKNGFKGISVGLESEFLWDYIFTNEIYNLIEGYFGGDFYLRNCPIIVFNYDDEEHGAQNFHLDWGLRQLSIMVSLTDVTEKSTHMEYLINSNQDSYFKHPDRFSNKFKSKVKSFLLNNPKSLFKTIGKKDQLFLFDAGNGFHRQVGGGHRIMLHLNFVDNLAFTNWSKNWSPNSDNENDPIWFQDISEPIKSSKFSKNTFSLVLRNKKPGLLIPKIFSKNF